MRQNKVNTVERNMIPASAFLLVALELRREKENMRTVHFACVLNSKADSEKKIRYWVKKASPSLYSHHREANGKFYTHQV